MENKHYGIQETNKKKKNYSNEVHLVLQCVLILIVK